MNNRIEIVIYKTTRGGFSAMPYKEWERKSKKLSDYEQRNYRYLGVPAATWNELKGNINRRKGQELLQSFWSVGGK